VLTHTSAVRGIAWSSTNTLATATANGELRLWSAAGALLRTYTYSAGLNDVAWHPSGSFLATGSDDGTVTMFEAATGLHTSLSGHFGNAVLHVGFNGTGDRLVSSSRATLRSDPTLVTWTVTDWNNFATLDQRFGAHADATTGFAVPAAEYAPGGVRIASGAMDATVKTWSPTLVQDRLLLGHRIGSIDTTRYNGGDGIADASGGMVYFIAQNGTQLPYSSRFVANQADNVANFVPANGTLVAFMGAFDAASKHGTLMASSIVGKAVTRFFDPTTMKSPSPPQVYGIAPNAKLIAVADIYTTTIFDGWRFAVEGYDGVPGTGDEAQIVANSFGFSSTFEDGWDFYSRFADWISTQYAAGKSLFTVSAGNDGNGYGTVTTPAASAGVVTAGASTDFFYRFWAGLEKGPSQSYGDVVPFSSRGPTALGRPDPDILATGLMSVGATPLNMVVPSNGALASELWSGTSLSSPMTAGILALIYEAYRKAHGAYPDGETAKSILMSGADDVNYDVFSQGAGFANADRATRIAQRLDGVSVTPTVWTPGTYQGRAYEAFVSLMAPGQSRPGTFTVRNANITTPATWTLSDSVFRRTATVEYGFVTPV
ncbi:MAG TPA: S8 family serine peptidase, partial [Thermoplasmata archaeon]|nr:S8 family serine peptidase [Thermoplasmata archaeon]